MNLPSTHNRWMVLLSLPLFMLMLSCTPKISPETKTSPATAPESPSTVVKDIFRYVNEHRQSLGLPPLKMNEEANRQAFLHSKNMATGKTSFGHEGFEQRVASIQKTSGWITASAENVAYGKLSANEVVKGWLNSPGHKKNIEGNYQFSGIGIYRDSKGVTFFTQIFFRN
ncbi:MAG: CAP domain-containing protein [Bacteroidota bacterium]|nr:CAP domain-containing protein [Bacteroidota bacterium]